MTGASGVSALKVVAADSKDEGKTFWMGTSRNTQEDGNSVIGVYIMPEHLKGYKKDDTMNLWCIKMMRMKKRV